MTAARPRVPARALLLAVLVVAALLRLQGINWDHGQHLHPDERFLTMVATATSAPRSVAEYFDTARSPLNPQNAGHQFFVYGTLPVFLVKAAASAVGWTDYASLHYVGRACSALVDLGTILLAYRLALLVAGPAAALATAALLAVSVTSIQQAHFFTVDSFATFFATAALLALAHVARGGGLAAHVLFGGALGATMACRINLALLGLLYPLAIAYVWTRGERRLVRDLAPAALAGTAAGVLVFRVLQPYAFAGPGFLSIALAPGFLQSLSTISGYSTGAADYPPSVQWIGRLPILFPGWNLLTWGIGPAWGIAAVAGLAWCLTHRRRGSDAIATGAGRIVLLWAPMLFLFHATQFVSTGRYFLPIVPLLALAPAWWLVGPSAGRVRKLAFVLVLLSTATWALAFTSIYRRPHTRVEASRWIYAHVPPGAVIATEHWDDALPLALDGRNAAEFGQVQLPLYDDENEQKRQVLLERLDRSDFIVLSSNRLYGSIPRAPWRYPLARRYYELLFAGELGFGLERVFASYPEIAGLEIRDDKAEEAFTVYDHPAVLVFRKKPDYSPARVASLLGAVSLSGVLRVPPRESSRLYHRFQPAAVALPGEPAHRAPAAAAPGSVAALVRWTFAFQLLALAWFAILFRPLAAARDRGYGLAKVLAWLGTGWLAWLVASVGLAASGPVAARAIAALVVVAGAVLAWRDRADLAQFWRQQRRDVIAIEAVFVAAFLVVLAVRAFTPAIFWGEKPMDFALFNACLRAVGMPPADPWFAGERLNYFYMGHALAAMFTHVAGVGPAFAYNLALATVGALLATAACILVHQVSGRVSAGAWAAGLVVAAGNLAGLRAFVEGEGLRIGFRDAWATSRVIEGTINEYPAWSFAFGDLHAHVLAMPLEVTLLYLGTLWLAGPSTGRRTGTLLLASLSAWLLGAVAVTSSWSTPTHVVLQLGFLVTMWLQGPRTVLGLGRVAVAWIGVVLGAYLLFLPFWQHYTAPDRHWGWLTSPPARAYDAVTIFGVFLAIALPAIAGSLARWGAAGAWRAAVVVAGIAAAALAGAQRSGACAIYAAVAAAGAMVWLTDRRPSRQVGALLVGAAGGLGVLTELVFVWDRMNTVFKYYLQMWLLLGSGAAMLAWSARQQASGWRRWAITLGLAAAALAGLLTSVTAVAGFLREPMARGDVPTLDGMRYLQQSSPAELAAYEWLQREVRGIPVVLEAQGPPYQAFGRVSMNTGLPTVLGWEYHLVQQARPRAHIDGRAADVRAIYDTTDLALAEQLLRRYQVDFVFVGPLERRTYAAAGLAKFAASALLEPVFVNERVTIYATRGRARGVKTWIAPVPPAARAASVTTPLREPRGVAAAPDGTLVVADFGNRRMLRAALDGTPLASFGREGEEPGEFRDPCGVAVAADGSIWVADTWNHRVQHFTAAGQHVSTWHADLFGPRGIAVGPDGSVYVTDTGHRRVVRFDAAGAHRVLVDQGLLRDPVGIALGEGGEVFVADTGLRQVLVFGPDGTRLHQWAIDGWAPGARVEPYLAVGRDGVVWVTDPSGGRVLLFDRDGNALGTALPDEPLELPLGIAVLAPGRAIVADAMSGRLVQVRRTAAAQGAEAAPAGRGESTRRLHTPTRKSPAR